jgi:hypothetical protein
MKNTDKYFRWNLLEQKAQEDADFQNRFLKKKFFSNSADEMLSEVFKNASAGSKDELALTKLRSLWKEVAGPLSAHSRPDDIQGEILMVTVEKPVYRQELGFSKPTILKKLHSRTDIKISDIRFHLGTIDWNNQRSVY